MIFLVLENDDVLLLDTVARKGGNLSKPNPITGSSNKLPDVQDYRKTGMFHCFNKLFETLGSVFHQISKHLKVCLKRSVIRFASVFSKSLFQESNMKYFARKFSLVLSAIRHVTPSANTV